MTFNKRTALFILIWILIALAVFSLRTVLLPFILAVLLAYVLSPAVDAMNRLQIKKIRVPRFVAVLVIYCLFAGFLFITVTIFAPELYRESVKLARDASELIQSIDDERIANTSAQIDDLLQRYSGNTFIHIDLVVTFKNLLSELASYAKSQSAYIVDEVKLLVTGVLSFVFEFFLVLMITAFILIDSRRMKDFLYKLAPQEKRDAFGELLQRIDQGLSGVVRGQLGICLVNGCLTLIGLLLLQVKFAFILATLAGLLSIIPIFGSVLSTIPIVIAALSNSVLTAALAFAWISGIHLLEANYLNPKILGNATQIHPVLILLSLVAGKYFCGITGALLAVPITSVVVTLFLALLREAQKTKGSCKIG